MENRKQEKLRKTKQATGDEVMRDGEVEEFRYLRGEK